LLPPGAGDSQVSGGFPLDLAGLFSEPDVFNIHGDGGSACVSVAVGQELPQGWRATPVRQVFAMEAHAIGEDTGLLGGLLRALHISNWRRESVFCGSCGAKNGDSPLENSRLCPACGRSEYPRVSPAVIVIVLNDNDEILLAHNKIFPQGLYSLIAGFNEPGESLERTVVREILEEVNVEVGGLRYIKSQPWPLPNSLMIGFSARYVSGSLKPDGGEIEDARWFAKDALPDIPAPGSLSRYLIDLWLAGSL